MQAAIDETAKAWKKNYFLFYHRVLATADEKEIRTQIEKKLLASSEIFFS